MKILVIDDDVYRMKPVIEFLTLYGYSVYLTNEYSESIEKINSIRYNLIIIDIMMPPKDFCSLDESNGGRETGFMLYKKIREIYKGPILFYTVLRNNEKIKYFLESDNKLDYLNKPSISEYLLDKINDLLK